MTKTKQKEIEDIYKFDDVISLNESTITVKSYSKFYLLTKRLIDIIISFISLVLFSPVLCVISLTILIVDKNLPFYTQQRVGKNGIPFKLLKFRSMKNGNIEDLLTPEELELYRKEFKLENDPRITKLGKFLRKTSLDELPQLVNILINDMSIVGPRPLLEDEIALNYGTKASILTSVKPGLTGYWQAYARNNATYESGIRQAMELHYIKNRSLWFDIKIFCKTFLTVLFRRGAK